MKGLLLLVVIAVAAPAKASLYAGKSDLSLAPSPVVFYEFVNREPRSGVDKPVWHLEKDGVESLHLGIVMSWNILNANPAVAVSAGYPIGQAGEEIGKVVNELAPATPDAPAFLKDAANFVTVEAFGGHEIAGPKWIGGIGGKVKVKYDMADLAKLFK